MKATRVLKKMQHLTCDKIYWQGMDMDITEYVKNCKICTKHKATQPTQPKLPQDIPEGPWQDLVADFFHHNNSEYLLIADTFCKYPFLYKLSSKTAEAVTHKIKTLICCVRLCTTSSLITHLVLVFRFTVLCSLR